MIAVKDKAWYVACVSSFCQVLIAVNYQQTSSYIPMASRLQYSQILFTILTSHLVYRVVHEMTSNANHDTSLDTRKMLALKVTKKNSYVCNSG